MVHLYVKEVKAAGAKSTFKISHASASLRRANAAARQASDTPVTSSSRRHLTCQRNSNQIISSLSHSYTMSFLGGNRSGGGLSNERIEAAMHECVFVHLTFAYAHWPHRMEMITDVFNRMVSYALIHYGLPRFTTILTHALRSCHAKCISTRYADAELSKGESVCVDRCIGKYFEANKLVGETLNSTAQASGSSGGMGGPMGM
jgi:import inner membrane translocase subunit TIM10